MSCGTMKNSSAASVLRLRHMYTKSHLSLSALYILQVAHFAQAELIYDGTAHSLDASLGRENTCVQTENPNENIQHSGEGKGFKCSKPIYLISTAIFVSSPGQGRGRLDASSYIWPNFLSGGFRQL
jgi:hypothetical protein